MEDERLLTVIIPFLNEREEVENTIEDKYQLKISFK
jgi:hypothetical protein